MGLMGTLAKVALGYAAARGVDKLSGGAGLAGLMGGGAQIKGQEPTSQMQAQMGQLMSGQMPDGAGNPMQEMMEKFQQGGLGAMMGGDSNPMAEMMDKVTGGFDLSSLMGGGGAGLAGAMAAAQGGGLSSMLDAFNNKDTTPESEEMAGLMLRAMIQAAKADGGIDEAEKAKLLETIGEDADPEDMAFVQAQLDGPVNPEALANDTPEAQRMQVYSASLMTIKVDTQAEAEYLHDLAGAMGLDENTVNMLHMQMGMQPLYN
ncbi:tellurite resistance TerB family protein [Tropicibacter sp. R15_0]|uniref:DUF533 domain-containing protein n=1 Tax=Tropicibacter sp. R15_0 TaxID=2821101 RepID=UPI001ADCF9EE|nr:DUF533 domain-containing protein [Tropicibacter sp. R15_0]MBO9466838.1 tellurite resistance TerB family protein [Tropicibacter sp. R15_0]